MQVYTVTFEYPSQATTYVAAETPDIAAEAARLILAKSGMPEITVIKVEEFTEEERVLN